MSSRSRSWPAGINRGQRHAAGPSADRHLKGFEGLACADPSALIDPGGALDRQRIGQSGVPQVEVPASDLDVEAVGQSQRELLELACRQTQGCSCDPFLRMEPLVPTSHVVATR